MAEVVNTYWAKFGIDATDFTAGIGQAQTSFLSFYRDLSVSVTMTIELFDKLMVQVKKYGEMADKLLDMAGNIGISTKELQQLHYAAALTGDSIESVDELLQKITLTMGQAADKTSTASKAFAAFGINPEGKSASEVLLELSNAVGKNGDVSDVLSKATDLLGRNAKQWTPFIRDFASVADEAKKSMYMTDAELKKADMYRAKMEGLGQTLNIFIGKTLFPNTAIGTSSNTDKLNEFFDQNLEKAKKTPAAYEDMAASASEYDLKMQDLKLTLADYIAAMDTANNNHDEAAFDRAAIGARHTRDAMNELAASVTNLNKATEPITNTFNTMFSSQMAGPVGQDWGGYSDLANKSVDELEEIAKGGVGKSKGYAEKAQQYLSMMKNPSASGSTAAAATTNDPKVKKIEDQNKKIADATKSGYVELEKMTLVHEKAEAEMSRVKYQSLLDYAAEAVNWAGSHPIIQKSAVLSKSGYDIDISALPTVTAPKLASADFGSIALTGGSPVGTGSGQGTTSNNNVTVNVYATTNDPKKIGQIASSSVADTLTKGGAT